MRRFEKISFEQFKKDVKDNIDLYNSFRMPSRETMYAAGYDFYALESFIIKPGEIKKVPTGIKVIMENDEVLCIHVRGKQGFKYNVRLINQTGIVDKDYYNNPGNEGHIWIGLQNEGKEDYVVNSGDGIAQGVFMKYLLTDNDKEELKEIRNHQNDGYLKEEE